ncbi:hypothetical protein DM860_012235 [Cuscuta australis]|uniref:Uncharacterized protein n=1 Tax=Cuscuta australis TaxID=267555 RepID=A0A328E7S3_9ASTE|nr:hypothetical protein DM860_012235 [Cuscuta australis]
MSLWLCTEVPSLLQSMAASTHTGKFFLTYLLIFSAFLRISFVNSELESESDSESSLMIEKDNENEEKYEPIPDALDVLNRHQEQLDKLEGLVKDLGKLVVRLESRFSDYPDARSLETAKPSVGNLPKANFEEKFEGNARDFSDSFKEKSGEKVGEKLLAVSVTKYSPFWSERFKFLSAVRVDSDATCINVLPFKDTDTLSKYVAVGDSRGQIYMFSRNGDVLVEFKTALDDPITALASFLTLHKNESVLLTAHKNGVILKHRVWEVVQNGEEWPSLRIETVGRFESPETGEGGSPITSLEVHHMGRNRFVLSVDLDGNLRVFRENGSVYGLAVPKSRPLAFLKQRLLFLTETGAGSLDLRTMRVRESECEGLNSSLAKTYVLDAIEWSKAYGFTSEGDMIHVLLLGDIINFKCRVRSKKKLEVGMNEPLAFQAIKGYLLISNLDKVWIYNVSSQQYVRTGGPKLVSSTGLDEVMNLFLNHQSADLDHQNKKMLTPLLASDREKLVILGTGNGYIAMYHSSLPVIKNEFNTMLWTSPVLLFILFLFGAWHFFANKKEALTSWGPDDPFSSTSDGATLGSDIMELRNGSLRGSAGRFGPQSQFQNSRPSSVDQSFRASPELKYRGPNLDNTSGFPKRREGIFVNSPVMDDS